MTLKHGLSIGDWSIRTHAENSNEVSLIGPHGRWEGSFRLDMV